MSKEFSIGELQKELRKINPFGDVISKSDFSKITEWIDTGNYHLNAVFSGDLFGGIPNNRTICLAGDSGTGKTFLLLNMVAKAQEMGYYVVYYDTEGAVDVDNIQAFGVDPEKFDHQPVSDIAKFRTSITTLCKKLMEAKEKGFKTPKIFIALDSLGMLATQKEIDDAISGNTAADMTRAKSIRSLFRIITSDLTGLGIPFVFTNHTYASTGMFPTVNLSGGGGLIYSASVILALSKAQIKEGTVQTGIIVTVKTLKNRFGKPIPIKFHIRWDKGMNPYIGMEEYMNWENCGIQKGNLITDKEYEKMNDKDKSTVHTFDYQGETKYFVPRETARNYIVKHLGKGIPANELFTPEVWTQEVLQLINEKCIKPKFSYGIDSAEGEVEQIFLNAEDSNDAE
jgi:RecA/RadA recombinase